MKKALAWAMVLCVGLFVMGCGGSTEKPKAKDAKAPPPVEKPVEKPKT